LNNIFLVNVLKYEFELFSMQSNYTGSLTTRNTYGLKEYSLLSAIFGDDWGLEVLPPVYQLGVKNIASQID
jgi:hypothetical protein